MKRIKPIILPLTQTETCKPVLTLEQKISELRETLNIPDIQDHYHVLLKSNNGFKRLCAALDSLEDGQRAIEKYKTIESFDYIAGDNLFLYGVLNALYIQQDSIRTWGELINEAIDFKDYPDTLRVREIRDDICHASDRRIKCGVSKFQIFTMPISHCLLSFDYLRFETATSSQETIHVDLAKCFTDQERDIGLIINMFIHKIKSDSSQH